MLNAEPYLIFNGNCREAFSFYETVFNTNIAFVSKYKDLPNHSEIPESDKDRIVHILLPISKQVFLMGADSPSDVKNICGNNIWLTLNTESAEEAEQVFERLSKDGEIVSPLEQTFWAERYGMLTDKFGICWMVSYNSKQK